MSSDYTDDHAAALEAAMLALPRKIAAQLATAPDAAHVQHGLTSAIRRALAAARPRQKRLSAETDHRCTVTARKGAVELDWPAVAPGRVLSMPRLDALALGKLLIERAIEAE